MRSSATILASCFALTLVGGAFGCASQLGGGIIDDDGDPGLGDIKDSQPESVDEDEASETPDDDGDETGKEDPSEDGSSSGDAEETQGDSTSSGEEDDSSDESPEDSGDGSSTESGNDSTSDEEPGEVTGDLEILFTTVSYAGKFAPYNVGAVWIETKEGSFVRTLKKWAGLRTVHLVKWRKATKSNDTDAITGATEKKHKRHSVNWDRLDTKGKEYKSGDFVLRLELTEENSDGRDPDGPTLSVPFSLGAGKESITPKDQKGFKDIELQIPG